MGVMRIRAFILGLLLASCTSPTPQDGAKSPPVALEFRLVATGVAPGKIRASTRGGEILLLERDVLLGPDHVASAQADGEGLDLQLSEEGSRRLQEIMRANPGRQLAIVADGVVLVAPEIGEPIEDGKLWIGDLTPEEARKLAGGLGRK